MSPEQGSRCVGIECEQGRQGENNRDVKKKRYMGRDIRARSQKRFEVRKVRG
jgi:hypothetical protein